MGQHRKAQSSTASNTTVHVPWPLQAVGVHREHIVWLNAPVSCVVVPDGHDVQLDIPGNSEYVPISHWVHCVVVKLVDFWPGLHPGVTETMLPSTDGGLSASAVPP